MDNDERTKLAQWSKDARRRSHIRMLDAVRKHRDMKQRLFDTEVRMEYAAADYQRTVLAGAHLPPVLSTIRFTAHTFHSETRGLKPNQPRSGCGAETYFGNSVPPPGENH
ncbi:MAG TPA: hypothetical protein VFN75_07810 [Pseudonocardiaceae bacterium]|nr:hypothetical protein [Pseudonocardiaceae bacterium]